MLLSQDGLLISNFSFMKNQSKLFCNLLTYYSSKHILQQDRLTNNEQFNIHA